MGLKILITGAGGFIAQSLVKKLLKETEEPFVSSSLVLFDRAFHGQPKFDRVQYFSGDINDYAALRVLFLANTFDVVVHLAGVLSKGESAENAHLIERVNVSGTLNMALLCSEFHSKMIFFSTGLVYGTMGKMPSQENMPCAPAGFYALSKYLGEEIIRHQARTQNLIYTIFRPSVIYGPTQRGPMFIPSLIACAVKEKAFPMTLGEQTRDFIYIDDVVNALCFALRNSMPGEYNLSSNCSRTIASVADVVAKWSAFDLKKGAIPYRNHETWDYRLDNSKLLLQGWQPLVKIETGLRTCFDSYKKGA